MSVENGTWVMYGVSRSDPSCLHSVEELEAYVERTGFLPLFGNRIPGFSVEERTVASDWWSDDPERDPWEWRGIIARRGRLAYGKFFDNKAGYISREWLPHFANDRRDGYDFDARWEDELASFRQKRIMDLFDAEQEYFSFEVKEKAGFGKGGEKNFEGTLASLQMQTYLCVRDFRPRLNRQGRPYGWSIAVLTRPETVFGRELVTAAYREEPSASRERIFLHMKKRYPEAKDKDVRKVLGLGKPG